MKQPSTQSTVGLVAVVGGSGLLGRALLEALTAAGLESVAPSRAAVDLSEAEEPDWPWDRPSVVVNAAAFTDVAGAERPERRQAVWAINADGAGILAGYCARIGARLIHLSTDYVFDGSKSAPYTEDDPVGPIQEYGRSKLAGEEAVRRSCPDALIVRTSTLFGPAAPKLGRPAHFIDAILDRAEKVGQIDVVHQPVSSPTYAPDLAQGIVSLIATDATGIVHLANAGSCSRFEFAAAAIEAAGMGGRVALATRPPETGPPARPAYSALDTTRFRAIVGESLRGWREALVAYVTEYRS